MVCRLVVENFAASNKIIPTNNQKLITQKEIKEDHNSDNSEEDFQE
jgi:hypothetical protein